MERVQKILAQAGIASRRACEEYIAEGKVQVNGTTIKLGDKANPAKDKITLNGKRIHISEKVYLLLNKPPGFVTTVSEQHGMRTVMELIPAKDRIFPVGRLDKHTEGLLLFTNDGDLANKLTHPRYNIQKEYHAFLATPPAPEHKEALQRGIIIEGKPVKPSTVIVKGKEVILTIAEGRKHIVRKLFQTLGFYVSKLVRTRMGPLDLGTLAQGKWRMLEPKEIEQLKKILYNQK